MMELRLWRRRRAEERVLQEWPGVVISSGDLNPQQAMGIVDVWSCIKLLADATASCPLIPYRRVGEQGRQRLTSGRLVDLLARPAPAVTQANLFSTAVAHLALYGNAYLGKFVDGEGRLEQLALLHPDRVTVELAGGQPRYRVSGPNGEQSVHGTDDIIHMKGLSLDGLVGLSPIQLCKVSLGLASGLADHAKAFFDNGARPSGVLSIGSHASKQQVDEIQAGLEARHVGAKNAHRIAILTGELNWQAITGPLDDLQFVEQRKLSTAEIARLFRIPTWMIGASSGDSLTYSNTVQMLQAFASFSLRPWLEIIEQSITADPDLCAGPNVFVEFLLDSLLRADPKTRSEIYAQALDPVTGWLRRDEVRRLENLPEETTTTAPTVAQLEEMIANGNRIG